MKKLLIGVIIILIAITAFLMMKEDREAPKIIFSEEEPTYTKGEDQEALLEGVSAIDSKDGDVSDSLVIDNITELEDKSGVVVVYVAKDSNNNIGKAERNLTYQASEQTETVAVTSTTGMPSIKLKTNQVTLAVGETFKPMTYVAEALDDVDNAWRKIHIDGKYSTSVAGSYTIKYSVTDSDGNVSNVEQLELIVK